MSKNFCLISITVLLSVNSCFAQTRPGTRLSPNEVRKDLEYFYKTLEESHYNLYVNTKKEVFEQEYNRIYQSVTDSLSLLQVTRLFQPFAALSKLAHCNIGFPFSLYYDPSNQDTARIFPFSVTIINHRAFIIANYSDDVSIEPGGEIMAIDGIPVDDQFRKIYNFLSGEGTDIKNSLVDLLTLPRIYWWIFGSQKEYSVTIQYKAGSSKSLLIHGIKASEYEQKISKKKSVFDLTRNFRLIGNIAYLHPGIFINNESTGNTSELRTFETNEFLSFIDSSYREIYKAGSKNLIIDLRGNPGGDNAFSDPMIAYFATKPFKFCSEFHVRTSSITKQFWKDVKDASLQDLKNQILTRKDGEVFKINLPNYRPRVDSLRFKGNVYVLVDKYSYSNAVSVAAIVQDYQFGKIIGVTTADVASSYGATHSFKLPHSQLDVSYPKAFIVRPNGDKALKGVIPDMEIQDNIFTDADEVLDYTINYIRKK